MHYFNNPAARVLALLCGMTVTPVFAVEPKVVVTVKPIHALVSMVMEGVGTPGLIVDGSASPHTFTLKPSGAKAINEADVFIRVSEVMEPFTRKVVEALPKNVRLVSLVDAPGMTVLAQRRGETFEKHEHHEAGHAEHDADDHDEDENQFSAKDGHIWLDPNNAKAIVNYAAKVLSETYPGSAAKFSANAAAAVTKLDALAVEIETQLAQVKGRPFIVFHDSTQYFEARFGLAGAGSVTLTPDVQPSAKRLTAVRKKILELGAVCVFAEPGFQPNLIAAVSEGTKAISGTVDPEGIALVTGPELYFELMRRMARSLKSCLDAAN